MSFSFEKVKSLKQGQIIWECGQYGSLQVELLEDPYTRMSEGGYEQVLFKAKEVKGGREINYLLTDKHMHYGPRLYNENQYITREELDAILAANKAKEQ